MRSFIFYIVTAMLSCASQKKENRANGYVYHANFIGYHLPLSNATWLKETYWDRDSAGAIVYDVDSTGYHNRTVSSKYSHRLGRYIDTSALNEKRVRANPGEWAIGLTQPNVWDLNSSVMMDAMYKSSPVTYSIENFKDSAFRQDYLYYPGYKKDMKVQFNYSEVKKNGHRFIRMAGVEPGGKREYLIYAGMVGQYWVLFKADVEDASKAKLAEELWVRSYFD